MTTRFCFARVVALWVGCLTIASPSQADVSVTVSANLWTGSGDFHTAGNWWYGGTIFFPNAPSTTFGTVIGPVEEIVNGLPAGFLLPAGPAVVSTDFTSTAPLSLWSWDGPSILKITNGATYLNTGTGIGDAPPNNYVPSGPVEPATLVLDGGHLASGITFYEHSRLEVLQSYAHYINWTGAPGTTYIDTNADFTIASILKFMGTVTNQGTITIAGTVGQGNSARMAFQDDSPAILTGGGELVLTHRSFSSLVAPSTSTLTNVDNTIRGTGFVYGSIINQSTIRAENGVLEFRSGSFDNTAGIIEIASDGALYTNGGLTITGGQVIASTGSEMLGQAGDGGLDSVQITGELDISSGIYRDVTLTSGSLINVPSGGIGKLAGTFTNQGTVTILGADNNYSTGLDIDNGETVTLVGEGEIIMTSLANSFLGGSSTTTLVNQDNTIRGTGRFFSNIVNQSTIRAEGGRLEFAAGSTLTQTSGMLEAAAGADIFLGNTPANILGGTVGGTGTIWGDISNQSGTASPGSSPGILTVNGNYTQESAASILIELGGLISGAEYDVLALSGTAEIAGLLDVDLIDLGSGLFTPSPGNSFTVLTASSLTGVFDEVSLPISPGVGLSVIYQAGSVTLLAGLAGDMDNDGFVGINDLNIVLSAWNQNVSAGVWLLGDSSGDGFVGIDDLNTVLGNWNTGTAPAGITAPEPTSLGVLLAGTVTLLRRARRTQ